MRVRWLVFVLVHNSIRFSVHNSVDDSIRLSHNLIRDSVWDSTDDSIRDLILHSADEKFYHSVVNSVWNSVQNIVRSQPKNQKVLRGVL